VLAALTLLAALALAACGGGTGSPTSSSSSESSSEGGSSAGGGESAEGKTIAMIPKSISDPYFQAADEGAQEAAKELGVTVEFVGPAEGEASEESEIIEQEIQKQPAAITLSALDPDALVPALERAQEAGIKTSTFDANTNAGSELFLNQTTFEAIGETIVEQIAPVTDDKGEFLVLTSELTAPNQNEWIKQIELFMEKEHPEMSVSHVAAAESDQAKARALTKSWLQANPETAGVITVDGNAMPGAAQAVKELGLAGKMPITGIGVPSLSSQDIHEGTVLSAVLWNPVDIGYAAIYMAVAQIEGTVKSGDEFLEAGRLGKLEFIGPTEILLGKPLVFTKENVDEFNF
jgi:ABC-type sugar transport system substrate-binding protein